MNQYRRESGSGQFRAIQPLWSGAIGYFSEVWLLPDFEVKAEFLRSSHFSMHDLFEDALDGSFFREARMVLIRHLTSPLPNYVLSLLTNIDFLT